MLHLQINDQDGSRSVGREINFHNWKLQIKRKFIFTRGEIGQLVTISVQSFILFYLRIYTYDINFNENSTIANKISKKI